MLEMTLWMFGVTIAVSVMVVTVAMEFYSVQFSLGAVIAIFIAVSALKEHRDAATAEKPNLSRLSAIIVRHMGILWAWAAVSICIIYTTIITWAQTWIPLFVLLILAAGTCFFVANILERDAAAGQDDENVMNFVGQIAKVQFALTCLLIGGLIAVGKFGVASFGGENKWPAVNILLCTAFGLAVISGFTIVIGRTSRTTSGVPSFGGLKGKTPSEAPPPRRRRPMARVV